MKTEGNPPIDSVIEKEAQRKLLTRLYDDNTELGLAGIGVALISSLIFMQVIDLELIITFFVLYTVNILLRIIIKKRFKSEITGNDNIEFWKKVAIIGAMSTGLLWGSFGLYYDPSWPTHIIVALFIIYTGLIAGVHTSYAVFPSVFAAFVIPTVTPLFFHIFFHGEHLLTVLFGIYIILMFRSSYRIRNFMQENVTTTIINERISKENLALIESIKQQNDLKEKVLMGAELGYWDWYPQSHEHFVSKQWLNILGLRSEDIAQIETDWVDRIHPDDKFAILLQIEDAIEKKVPYIVHFRMRHSQGHYVWIEGSGAVVEWDANDQPFRLSGTHRDISEQKRHELEYEKQRIYMKTLFDLNPNITIIVNKNGLLDANYAFFEFFNEYANITEFREKYNCMCELFEFIEDPSYLHPSKGKWFEQAIDNKDTHAIIKKNGKVHHFDVAGRSVFFADSKQYIFTFNNTTKAYNLQLQLEENAFQDPMTMLYNRRYYNKTILSIHATTSRLKGRLGFMMLDIDNFKKYNDNYGHDKGDEALIETAKILQSCFVRKSDVVCRMGGEEFGVIVSDMSENEIMLHAQMVCQKIFDAHIPHLFNNNLGYLTISIGVSWCDFSLVYKNIEQFYKEADLALYDSKKHGRNRASLFLEKTQMKEV